MSRRALNSLDRARTALPSVVRPLLLTVVSLSALVMIAFVARRVRHFGWRRGWKVWRTGAETESSRVDFYERFIRLLEKEGWKRETYQTPLEFAAVLGRPEAAIITTAYNRVRFGEEQLSPSESRQLEEALARLKEGNSR